MRSYDEFRNREEERCKSQIAFCRREFDDPVRRKKDEREKELFSGHTTYLEAIELLNVRLEHLDEVVPYVIAYETQRLLNALSEAYRREYSEYINFFDNMFKRLDIGFYLGMSKKEFEFFRDKNPTLPETRDSFIQIVNQTYGLNIPNSAELKNANDVCEKANVTFGLASPEYAEAYCKLRELQRNAGLLTGGLYNGDLLDMYDTNYIAAKERIAKGKNR